MSFLNRFGLKRNPFGPDGPREAYFYAPGTCSFAWRLENLAREGGFALITGEPGTGKSVTMRFCRAELARHSDLVVGVLTRPQSSLPDFYRELGELFGVVLRPSNRWAGTKALRERWQAHIEASRLRAVLLIDEAQEMQPRVLNELRLLSAAELDASALLTIVLAGDHRLQEALTTADLRPLRSRVRVQLRTGTLSPPQLEEHLRHVLEHAGNPALMTDGLIHTLCEHAAGNLRVLMMMGGELLDAAAQRDQAEIDEALYLDVFARHTPSRKAPKRKRAE